MNRFKQEYQSKLCSPIQAAEQIGSGRDIWIDIALAQPKELISAMKVCAEQKKLQNIKVHTMLDIYPAPWYQPQFNNIIQGVSWFSGSGARNAVNMGIADVMPCYYRDVPRHLRDNPQIDCVCACVSPMDKHGYFSMGTTSSGSMDMIL